MSVVTDSSGTVKNTYSYDPWGNSLGKTEAVSNPWQFASGFYDATTGLYKFGTRYYSPTLGRWTQQDPVGGSVGKVGSGNAYVYADDAPVMTTDPSGRDAIDCYLAIAGTAALSIGGTAGMLLALAATGVAAISAFIVGLMVYAGAIIYAIQENRAGVCSGVDLTVLYLIITFGVYSGG